MYTSTIVEAKANPLFPAGFDVDRDFVETQDPSWPGYRIMIYRKNSKNWDTLNYYRDCPTNGIVGFYSAILRSKEADRITNRVDTHQTAP